MPWLVFGGVMHLTLHCCPLLGSPTAVGLREVSARDDNLFFEAMKVEILPEALCPLHGKAWL